MIPRRVVYEYIMGSECMIFEALALFVCNTAHDGACLFSKFQGLHVERGLIRAGRTPPRPPRQAPGQGRSPTLCRLFWTQGLLLVCRSGPTRLVRGSTAQIQDYTKYPTGGRNVLRNVLPTDVLFNMYDQHTLHATTQSGLSCDLYSPNDVWRVPRRPGILCTVPFYVAACQAVRMEIMK